MIGHGRAWSGMKGMIRRTRCGQARSVWVYALCASPHAAPGYLIFELDVWWCAACGRLCWQCQQRPVTRGRCTRLKPNRRDIDAIVQCTGQCRVDAKVGHHHQATLWHHTDHTVSTEPMGRMPIHAPWLHGTVVLVSSRPRPRPSRHHTFNVQS